MDITELGDTLKLPLKKQIGLGDQKWDELDLIEPSLAQVMKAEEAGSGNIMMLALLSAVTKVPQLALKQLAYSDFRKADAFLAQFASAGRKTGDSE
jgi:hypothetical protein